MTVVKIDDILISGKNSFEHIENLKTVLKILSDLGLTLNRSKCKFLEDVDKSGIRTNREKVRAIENAPEPSTITELQIFLGGVNYYSKFLPNMSDIANPLYDGLLRKNTVWHQQAFETSASV